MGSEQNRTSQQVGGPVPTPLHAGAPGQRQIVSLLGWARGGVRLVLSCAVMSMYVLKDDKEMFFRPAKQWDL